MLMELQASQPIKNLKFLFFDMGLAWVLVLSLCAAAFASDPAWEWGEWAFDEVTL
jgi:hypothetical protein